MNLNFWSTYNILFNKKLTLYIKTIKAIKNIWCLLYITIKAQYYKKRVEKKKIMKYDCDISSKKEKKIKIIKYNCDISNKKNIKLKLFEIAVFKFIK